MYFQISIFMRLIFFNIIDDATAIHNGRNVQEGSFKFTVHIDSVIGNEYYSCGGVVIDEFHVITAAHCIACSKLSEIAIIVGSVSIPAPRFFFHQPVEVHPHPNYTSPQKRSIMDLCLDYLTSNDPFHASESRNIRANDIAVVKVDRRIKLGDTFTHIDLPVSESLPYCDLLQIASWYTPKASSWSATLQSTEVELINDNDCTVPHLSEHFCANTMDRVERFGLGDSGSPLVHNNTLYGIIVGGSCTSGAPFLLIKIFYHMDFITELLEKGRE